MFVYNATLGASLESYQKSFAGLVAGRVGRYHADPLLGEFGMLKIGEFLGGYRAFVCGGCYVCGGTRVAGKPTAWEVEVEEDGHYRMS